MKIAQNIFLEKKILIYGLGKTGISSYKFLKDLAQIYLFDSAQLTVIDVFLFSYFIVY